MDYFCLTTLDCKQGAIRAVRFNVDGSYCLTCGADKKIKLWNPHRSLLLKTYGGHGNDVLDACGSCDSSQIASGGSDKSVIVWDVGTGQPLRRLRGHASRVTCVKYNEESTVVVSGSHDNTVMFWDVRSRNNEPIQVLRDAKDCVTSLKVTNHEILTGSLDCKIRRYDIRTGEVFTDFVGESVTCVSFTRDEQCIVLSSTDSTIRLFDKTTGELLQEFRGHSTGEFCVESSVDSADSCVVSGSCDGAVWWWDLVQSTVVARLVHGQGTVVHSVDVHPTQPFLLSAAGATVKLWGRQPVDDEET